MARRMREAINKRFCRLAAKTSAPILVLLLLSLLVGAGCGAPPQNGRQAMVHEMGHQVMPFDLKKTLHVFEMTESGGVQQVIARDPTDKRQITFIQHHLQLETGRFRHGDFSDPLSLHGTDMPGLKDLAAGAARIKIEFMALTNGGQITFTTHDLHLITAVHRWFGAQLSDHGSDATSR
jgi:hypothetical protein